MQHETVTALARDHNLRPSIQHNPMVGNTQRGLFTTLGSCNSPAGAQLHTSQPSRLRIIPNVVHWQSARTAATLRVQHLLWHLCRGGIVHCGCCKVDQVPCEWGRRGQVTRGCVSLTEWLLSSLQFWTAAHHRSKLCTCL